MDLLLGRQTPLIHFQDQTPDYIATKNGPRMKDATQTKLPVYIGN
jgi:hypothetical protein